MSQSGLRFASVCAVLSAMTTFLLWLLPRMYSAANTFEAAVARHTNPYYLARLWVNFAHIFLALVAYGATAYVLYRLAPALSSLGYLWFVLWGFTELLGVTVNIFAVNRTWRAGFATASDQEQLRIRANLAGFDAVWDAMFFLLLVAFLLATTCFGLAALRGDMMTRWVGVLFLLATPLTIGIMISGYTKITAFDTLLDAAYPVLQPVSRGFLGYWLWVRAGNPAASIPSRV